MADTERTENHVLCQDGTMGQIKIADDVIAVIAALAATEVEGVDSMAGNITHELIRKLGMKNLQKGVKIELTDEDVSCALSLNVDETRNEEAKFLRKDKSSKPSF